MTPETILEWGSLTQIGGLYRHKQLSVREAANWYLARIEALNHAGPALNAVKDVSEEAVHDAELLDAEFEAGVDRGPLHGIPVLVKANVMMGPAFTVHAGAAFLRDFRPSATATLVRRLRAAGALILGQTNMTEFADYVSDHMPSEFSGAGGVVRNPHGLTYGRGQGSSVGSAAAVAAGLAPLAVGGETQNSIQTPACYSSVVGFKPTLGAVSRAGVIPLVPSQDAPGFLARTVEDAGLATAAVRGGDPRDAATLFASAMRAGDGAGPLPTSLDQVRIGVPRRGMADREQFASVIDDFEAALSALGRSGAAISDPCDLPSAEQIQDVRSCVFASEFKAALEAFLGDHDAPGGVRSLTDLIAWNEAHPEAIPYGQSLIIAAEKTRGLDDPTYLRDRRRDLVLTRRAGIDSAIVNGAVHVLAAPMGAAAKCTGKAGAPTIAIPVGKDKSGTPFGITLYARPGDDQLLLAVARLVWSSVGALCRPQLETWSRSRAVVS